MVPSCGSYLWITKGDRNLDLAMSLRARGFAGLVAGACTSAREAAASASGLAAEGHMNLEIRLIYPVLR